MQASLFEATPEPVAVVSVALLRRILQAAPAQLRDDPEVGVLAAELGVEFAQPAQRGIDPDWLGHAVACVRRAAERKSEITAEDVWALLKRPPARPNDIGHALGTAAASGYIERTDRFAATTTSRVSGGRQKRVWRSLVRNSEAL